MWRRVTFWWLHLTLKAVVFSPTKKCLNGHVLLTVKIWFQFRQLHVNENQFTNTQPLFCLLPKTLKASVIRALALVGFCSGLSCWLSSLLPIEIDIQYIKQVRHQSTLHGLTKLIHSKWVKVLGTRLDSLEKNMCLFRYGLSYLCKFQIDAFSKERNGKRSYSSQSKRGKNQRRNKVKLTNNL